MYSFKCGECLFATKRSYNLRRHSKNVHGIDKSKAVSTKSTFVSSHSGDGITRYEPMTESENGIKTFDEEFETNKSHNSDCVLNVIPRVLNVIPDHLMQNCMDPRWKHPFAAFVAGPTGCGKTVFTLKFITLASEMITPVPEKIIWCFGVYQDEFDMYPDIDFREGLSDPGVIISLASVINFKVNTVFPHRVGPATKAVKGCFHLGSISKNELQITKFELYIYILFIQVSS